MNSVLSTLVSKNPVDQKIVYVNSLGKQYGTRWVFRGLSFDLTKGQVLVVRGPNGSGKSTLLRILAGLTEHSEGQVKITSDFGYAALDLALYPNLTPREHLELITPFSKAGHSIQFFLNKVALSLQENQLVGEFSTGMRARLKLAMAIYSEPRLLLIDEPTAPLDEGGLELVKSIIDEQKLRGGVILATNNPEDCRFATHELELV